MLPDRVSNPGPLTYKSGALPIALRGPVLCALAVIRVLPFLNTPKDLDPSYKMDLDFWDCFGKKTNSVL